MDTSASAPAVNETVTTSSALQHDEHQYNESGSQQDKREAEQIKLEQHDQVMSSDVKTDQVLDIPAPSQDTLAQILQFFAGASDGVLVGIAVAVSGLLYLIFGQLGLLAVGTVAGALLHAHWAGLHGEKEMSIAALEKALEGRGAQKIKSMLDVDEDETEEVSGYKDFRPETAAALDEITARTIEDYVSYWYAPNYPGELSFPKSAQATLVAFVRSVSRTLSKKRPADAFILFLTNTSSILTTFFGELGNAIKESTDVDVAPEDAVGLYLQAHPDSTLSYLLDEKQQRTRFLRESDDMLRHHIDKSVYNCLPAKTFLQQTLSMQVFETTLKTISKAEWLNGWIVYLLEEGEPDLLQAIDAGMSTESKAAMKPTKDNKASGHEKRMSRAVDDQAMEEARRLSELMAEEDTRRASEAALVSPPILEDAAEEPVEEAVAKPAVEPEITPASPPKAKPEVSHARSASQFTSFDQLPTPKVITEDHVEIPPLTLHNANITILDDSMPGDKNRTLRSKPSDDYVVQIEPQDSRHSGWMIVRRYDDFENLHEVLKRIAHVSGAAQFTKNHATLPAWKGETKPGLRIGLENYLMSACHYQALAESIGLKKFLEKEHQGPTGKAGPGIGWPSPAAFENMGKGLVDNLMTASKGAADGGKSVFGGIGGVFTGNRNRSDSKASLKTMPASRSSTNLSLNAENSPVNGSTPTKSLNGSPVGNRERSDSKASLRPSITSRSSTSLPRLAEYEPLNGNSHTQNKPSNGSLLSISPNGNPPASLQTAVHSIMAPAEEEKTPTFSASPVEDTPAPSLSGDTLRASLSELSSDTQSLKSSSASEAAPLDMGSLHLPPPPDEMPDDYEGAMDSPILSPAKVQPSTRASIDTFSSEKAAPPPKLKLERKEPEPFTEQETRDSLELIFAMISSLYTLSSAWGLRRTLLTAAKTFLLRPGNPSLAYIQKVIQESVIVPNTSDEGIAAHLKTIRANALPTAEELAAWPKEMDDEEKEKLRTKARALLLEKGVPPALTGIMGMQATQQALGRVFDTLQDERVLRGLMFGLLMQGVSLITH